MQIQETTFEHPPYQQDRIVINVVLGDKHLGMRYGHPDPNSSNEDDSIKKDCSSSAVCN